MASLPAGSAATQAAAPGASVAGGAAATTRPRIPVTVFTGFLGAGKTTIIRHLVASLPPGYPLFWLKNEFGDVEVDAEVARASNIAVKEILNGCLCCTLVGQLGDALAELAVSEPPPARILLETSGSAYPAPLAWEVAKHPGLLLDGIVTVIDVMNFKGYTDKTYTAKLQAQYTDLLLINKHELVTEAKLERVLDDVYDLNPDTPKIKTDKGKVSAELVFGLDRQLAGGGGGGSSSPEGAGGHAGHGAAASGRPHADHHAREVDVLQLQLAGGAAVEKAALLALLAALPADDVVRAKGLVRLREGETLTTADGEAGAGPASAPSAAADGAGAGGPSGGVWLFNLVRGRRTFEWLPSSEAPTKAVFMGWNLKRHRAAVAAAFGAPLEETQLHEAGRHEGHDHGPGAHDHAH